MLNAVKAAPRWLIDGLSDAVVACLARFDRRPTYRIDLAGGNAVVDAHGVSLGRLAGSGDALRFEPPDLATRLTDTAIDVELPPAWVWRRGLQPIGIDSVAYLDAFVSHQIERISPWRSSDVYYKVTNRPIADDPTRLAVEVGVVPKQIVDHIIAVLKPLASRLHLTSRQPDDREALIISVGANDNTQRAYIRRLVVTVLALVSLAIAGWFASVQWTMAEVDSELADLDQQISTRKAALAVNRDSFAPGAAEALRARRASQPYIVELVDALSQILPDHAHLLDLRFEKDLIRISGISGRTSELVPVLEQSGRFADVKFAAATTRLDDGRLDRFHLEMRAAAAHEPPP